MKEEKQNVWNPVLKYKKRDINECVLTAVLDGATRQNICWWTTWKRFGVQYIPKCELSWMTGWDACWSVSILKRARRLFCACWRSMRVLPLLERSLRVRMCRNTLSKTNLRAMISWERWRRTHCFPCARAYMSLGRALLRIRRYSWTSENRRRRDR